MPPFPSTLVKMHQEFFFPDGNLILVAGALDPTGTLAFRLHRGIVNRWSPVFHGMTDALEVAADPWTYLGCGVLVFDDDANDFERLIRALCDGTTPLDSSLENFPILASLLKLSHKYGITHLENLMLNQLISAYPPTLSAWDVREAYSFSPAARHDRLATFRAQRPHPLAVIDLALQLGAPNILVSAYLDLARFPVSEIIRGYTLVPPSIGYRSAADTGATSSPESKSSPAPIPTLHLPIIQTTAVLRGKETLQRFIADFIKANVENHTQPPLCRYIHMQVLGDPLATPPYPCAVAFARISHEILVMTAGVAGGVDSDPLFVLKCAEEMLKESQNIHYGTGSEKQDATVAHESRGDESATDQVVPANSQEPAELNEGACPACTESFRQSVNVARQHIWDHLPKWFDLKKFMENGFETGWA